jgi:hypothetical protein
MDWAHFIRALFVALADPRIPLSEQRYLVVVAHDRRCRVDACAATCLSFYLIEKPFLCLKEGLRLTHEPLVAGPPVI